MKGHPALESIPEDSRDEGSLLGQNSLFFHDGSKRYHFHHVQAKLCGSFLEIFPHFPETIHHFGYHGLTAEPAVEGIGIREEKALCRRPRDTQLVKKIPIRNEREKLLPATETRLLKEPRNLIDVVSFRDGDETRYDPALCQKAKNPPRRIPGVKLVLSGLDLPHGPQTIGLKRKAKLTLDDPFTFQETDHLAKRGARGNIDDLGRNLPRLRGRRKGQFVIPGSQVETYPNCE